MCAQLDADALGVPRDDDSEVPGELKDVAIRNPIQQETAESLVPILRNYIEDRTGEEGDILVSEEKLPRDRQPPAGYYKKAGDHIVDTIVVNYSYKVQTIDNEQTAKENIETLTEHGYADDEIDRGENQQ